MEQNDRDRGESGDSRHPIKGVVRTAVDTAQSSSAFPIVGIGASAGGLRALELFFANMPQESGMAFIIVTHLSPNHKSMLAELLSHHAPMPVQTAAEGTEVCPNQVYVAPPNVNLDLQFGHLHLDQPTTPRGHRQPIDAFLRSLAAYQGESAIAVILSGTGSDGTEGVRAVKEAGGLVIVQDASSAQYPAMPQSAVHSGQVDLVLPVEQIPEMLLEYVHRAERLTKSGDGEQNGDFSAYLPQICKAILQAGGDDFSGYKPNTLLRRIRRRMHQQGFIDGAAYARLVRENSDEALALSKDVLIGVTSFFRDPEAFEVLRSAVIPKLLEGRSREMPARIWVAGCATGEEAYSVAIALLEAAEAVGCPCHFQIFASDVDAGAIAYARAGLYPKSVADDMGAERIDRFFVPTQSSMLQIVPPVRDHIVFAHHNLLRDPPFSRLDLLCCRNMLIYLKPETQRKVLPLLHQSLRAGGVLFLGSSETIGPHEALFTPIDKKWRLYQRREPVTPVEVTFPMHIPSRGTNGTTASSKAAAPAAIQVGALAHAALVRRYAPPAVVVNDQYKVLHYCTKTTSILEPPVGEPTDDLLTLVLDRLRPAVRAAVHKAITQKEVVVYRGLRVNDDETRIVDLRVEPFLEHPAAQGLALVIFEDPALMASRTPATGELLEASAGEAMIQQLEEQLRINQAQLQATVDQLASSNEELKSSNEELMSMNEELQSSNEELETSKEEHQALNEELITVNAELQSKLEQLAQANGDMQNLINSSHVATLFLDRHLNIKRFTPALREMLDLIEADVGRSIAHIASRLPSCPTFATDATQVLESLHVLEREVKIGADSTFLVNFLPYRSVDDVIDGVVITFVNVSDLKRVEEELRLGQTRLNAIMGVTDAMLVYMDTAFNFVCVNPSYAETCRRPAEELLGKNHFSLFPSDENEEIFKRVRDTGVGVSFRDRAFTFPDQPDRGVTFWDWTLRPVTDRAGAVIGLVFSLRETTERVQTIEALRESEQRHRIMSDVIPYGVWLTDPDGQARYISESWLKMVGLTLEEACSYGWIDTLVPEQREEVQALWRRSVETGAPFEHEHKFRASDGTFRIVLARGLPIRRDDGKVTAWAGINLDITDRKRAEQERNELLTRLEKTKHLDSLGAMAGGIAHEFNNILATVLGYAECVLIDGPSDARIRANIEPILDAVDRAKSLVAQIMSVGKPIKPNPSALSVDKLLELSVRDARRLFHAGPPILVRTNSPDSYLFADGGQLSQVLLNLLINACEAAQLTAGKVEIDVDGICVSAEQSANLPPEGEWIRIVVSDTGPGIPQSALDRVFEPFFTTKPVGKGTGLGLAVVHAFVRANKGEVHVHSVLGQGTRFTLYLPRIFPDQAAVASLPSHQSTRERKGRVIFVDDEPVIAEMGRRILTLAGFDVRIFVSPASALEFIKGAPDSFDVLVTDQRMSPMAGHELARKVRTITPKVPIALCTGFSEIVTAENCGDFGIDRVLNKPFVRQVLVDTVAELLESSRG